MEKHQIVIDIAAYGWQSAPWQGFYPADLPEDWRLDFYSNEFRSVLVPAGIWQQTTTDIVEEWLDAVHDQFRFYFEVSGDATPSGEQKELITLLGAQWGGWICRTADVADATPSVWYEGGAQPRQMREAIEQLEQNLRGETRGVIVVNSTDEPWEVASDMRQLVELMGYG